VASVEVRQSAEKREAYWVLPVFYCFVDLLHIVKGTVWPLDDIDRRGVTREMLGGDTSA
jgi:hypothetical protein